MIPIRIVDCGTEWQRDEDAILGRMIRQILSLEGEVWNDRSESLIEGIVANAMREAKEVGARPEWIRSVANRIRVHT